MLLDLVLGSGAALLVAIYLVAALLRPERF